MGQYSELSITRMWVACLPCLDLHLDTRAANTQPQTLNSGACDLPTKRLLVDNYRDSLEDFLEACRKDTAKRLADLLEMESTVPFTLDNEGFLSTKAKILEGLLDDHLPPNTESDVSDV